MSETDGRAAPPGEIVDVPLENIDIFAHQSREAFDEAELKSLADNMQTQGQLQPGVAWLDPGRGRLVLVCGERRFRALKLAGLPSMRVSVIRGHLTQGQMLAMNLAENLQRCSLNPIERAKGFQRLMQLEDLNASEVAARMSVSNATVSNSLALLDLSEPLQARVAAGTLPATVAAHIARTGDDETRRSLAEQYEAGSITRAGVAAAVSRSAKAKANPLRPKGSHLVCRVEGIVVNLAADSPLTLGTVLSVCRRLLRDATAAEKNGESVTDLAARLKAAS